MLRVILGPLALLLLTLSSGCAASLDTPRPDPTVRALEAQVAALNARLDAAEPASTPARPRPLTPEAPPPDPTLTPTSEEAPTPEPARVFPTRSPRLLTAADAAPCSPGQIKGNRNSRIYHLPTGGSYVQTKANVQCFDSEGEAQAAGYRRALN